MSDEVEPNDETLAHGQILPPGDPAAGTLEDLQQALITPLPQAETQSDRLMPARPSATSEWRRPPQVLEGVVFSPPNDSSPFVPPRAGKYEFTIGNADVFRRFCIFVWGSVLLVVALIIGAALLDSHVHTRIVVGAGTAVFTVVGVLIRIVWARTASRDVGAVSAPPDPAEDSA